MILDHLIKNKTPYSFIQLRILDNFSWEIHFNCYRIRQHSNTIKVVLEVL